MRSRLHPLHYAGLFACIALMLLHAFGSVHGHDAVVEQPAATTSTTPTTTTMSTTTIVNYNFNETQMGWNGSCPWTTVTTTVVQPVTVPPATSASSSTVAEQFGEGVAAWVGFFFIVLASSQCALVVRYVQLPLITGYMFFGVLVGPQILQMVSKSDISYLQPITQTALAFISLSAGAELYLPELRALFRRIITITSAVTVICFFVCLFVIWGLAAAGLVPFMSDLSGGCQFSISLIAASIMVTQSPASAIAVVAEMRAKGPFTSTMLGITVLTDIVVLLLYSICAAVANANCSADDAGFKILDLGITIACILSAMGLGYLFGKLIIFIIWLPRPQFQWLVLPLGWACFYVSSWFTEFSTEEYGHGINFDPLLICIFAGYVVANHSRNRRKFLRFLSQVAPIIFIPFFTLTGAGLNLKVMGQSAPFAFIVFGTRALTFFGGTTLGGRYTGMEKLHLNTLWLSMLTQAGVSLGIAAEVAIAFPAWGSEFQSCMVSVILINQIVGPVLCKWAIKKNGEDGQATGGEEDEDEEHIKRCVLIGINISSLAVAQRLLKQDWNVLFIDTDVAKTDMLQWLKYEKRAKKVLTPAQIAARKKRDAKKRAEEVQASNFVDLAPPVHSATSPSPDGSASPDTTINVSPDDLPAEPSRVGDAGYAPVDPGSDVNPFDSASVATSASASEPAAGDAHFVEDMNKTTTPLDERQVQFRLLEPTDPTEPLVAASVAAAAAQTGGHASSSSAFSSSATSKFAYPREVAGLRVLTADLNAHNVEAAVVMMERDELNFELCTVLQEQLQLQRVIVEVQNPMWTSSFASIGIWTIFPYSLSAHALTHMITKHAHEPLELVRHDQPLHVALSHIIKPDTQVSDDEPPLYLRNLSGGDQTRFLEQHPDPPLPRDQMWKFDEKLKVVSAATRDEYVNQIHSLHTNNTIKLDLSEGAKLSAMTFSGPGMLSETGGNDDIDMNDPEEVRFQELRRADKAARLKAKEEAKLKQIVTLKKTDEEDL